MSNAYAATNIDRIVANLIRFGRIDAVDYESGTATVDFDGEIIEGLEWAKPRAGDDRKYHAPSKDEQVCVLSPSGDLAQGVIAFSISQERFPNAGNNQNPKTIYADGTVVEYDKEAHILTVDCSASSGTVNVTCANANVIANSAILFDTPEATFTGNLTVQKNINVNESLGVNGDSIIAGNVAFTGNSIKHDGKEIGSGHKHGGVKSGTDEIEGVI